MNGKVLCLICIESTAVLKEYNIARHYNSSVRAVEMIDSSAKNFKMTFNDFRSHATNIHIFETHSLLKSAMLQKKIAA
jgi:hypothetical protein